MIFNHRRGNSVVMVLGRKTSDTGSLVFMVLDHNHVHTSDLLCKGLINFNPICDILFWDLYVRTD